MKRLQNALTLFAFALVLTGCAALGAPKPVTFDQRMAYAISEVDAVVKATDVSLQNGEISSANSEAVLAQADNIRQALATANKAFAPCVDPVSGKPIDPKPASCDITGANSGLSSALIALTALQAYVNAHGGNLK